jgi:cytochrome c oxidase cbb3-type subunit III
MSLIRRKNSDAYPARANGLPLSFLHCGLVVFAFAALVLLVSLVFGQTSGIGKMPAPGASVDSQKRRPRQQSFSPALVASGRSLFLQNCSFCHGRDAGGGESGPDLTRSTLVAKDVRGNRIAPVVLNGRPGKGMPAFNMPDMQIAALVAFIHAQRDKALTQQGGRRGVDVADLQTGNAAAGKQFFYGAGGCSLCHSPAGDLAGIASKYQGLQLEERMLYPDGASSKVTVTLRDGQVASGTLAYQDEFTLGLRDAAGYYHSWPVSVIKYSIDSPVQAHVKLLGKYTDADIHNLMAYLQTLH